MGMDTDTAGPYAKARYDEGGGEMKNMLLKVGWKKDFVAQSVPVLPLSGWMGDNLIEKMKNMDWWTGCDVIGGPDGKTKMHVDTLKECLNDFCSPPVRTDKAEMRMPVSGIYKIKGLEKQNMPRVGDVMIYKKDKTLTQCGEFDAQIQTLDIPGEIKLGYSPIGFVRCGRSACRATAFKFKVGKETGGKKMESPHSLKSNEMAQVSFRPQQPL